MHWYRSDDESLGLNELTNQNHLSYWPVSAGGCRPASPCTRTWCQGRRLWTGDSRQPEGPPCSCWTAASNCRGGPGSRCPWRPPVMGKVRNDCHEENCGLNLQDGVLPGKIPHPPPPPTPPPPPPPSKVLPAMFAQSHWSVTNGCLGHWR